MAGVEVFRRWAAALPQARFAAAWFAMGVFEAALRRPDVGRRHDGVMRQDPLVPAPRRAHALEVVSQAVEAAGRRAPLDWVWPAEPGVPGPAARAADLLTPPSWAEVGEAVLAKAQQRDRVGLRVRGSPEAQPVAACAQALASAAPWLAVSFDIAAPAAQLHLEWPLRLGTLESLGAAAVSHARGLWPADKLARAVALGRDEANCDVLVHVGSAAQLAAALLAGPAPIKADLIVVVGGEATQDGAFGDLERLLLSQTRAGGVALVPWPGGAQELGAALNGFMRSFSHDETIDVALHANFEAGGTRPLLWMCEALATMRLGRVAQQMNARMQELPQGTDVDLARVRTPGLVRRSARPVVRRGAPVPLPPSMPSPQPAGAEPALEIAPERLRFDAESEGASDLVELAQALERAQEPPEARARRAQRFLQQRSSVVAPDGRERPASSGFVAGLAARVVVRIGPPEAAFQSLATPFPDASLPKDTARHRLAAWLTEPAQLAAPLRCEIVLPRDGASSEGVLEFVPRAAGSFDGRVSVLHRGRVLQTAALRAAVQADLPATDGPEGDGAPRLEELAGVRRNLGDLDARRQFDLALVANHTATGQPRVVGLSDQRAWIADTAGAQDTMAEINAELSKVANSVLDYANGLDGEDGRQLLVKLAQGGAYLKIFLVDEQLRRPGNNASIAAEEYVQIVSVRNDAAVPFEFIYDLEVPGDAAQVCPNWRAAVEAGRCPQSCDGGAADRVCPMGFWGLRKVIERHQLAVELQQDGKEIFLQSEPGRACGQLAIRGPVLLAGSRRVASQAMQAVADELARHAGVSVVTARSWEEWVSAVENSNPGFILSMPHTDGTGSGVSLEISDKVIKTIQITARHVCPTPASHAPIVALLGCDVATSAQTYTRHVAVFRARGAAVVVATIATVFGGHAADVAALLARELLRPRDGPFRLGEAVRDIKRRSLLAGQLMPLCIVAYGDADWQITH